MPGLIHRSASLARRIDLQSRKLAAGGGVQIIILVVDEIMD
jgi:hypothetical protein